MPDIDFAGVFAAAANAALNTTLSPPFDPFSGTVPFLLGAYIFEDVGVTAYKVTSTFVEKFCNVSFLIL